MSCRRCRLLVRTGRSSRERRGQRGSTLREAFPWQADWYRNKVKENLGAATDDNFRLWYTDHALHGDFTKQEDPGHTVSYLGVLQQALRDLAAWVEKGVTPPESTSYKVVDGQIVVPATAAERKGVEPTIALTVNGGAKAEVKVGQRVALSATIAVPPGAGSVVAAEWDFEGAGADPVVAQLDGAGSPRATVTASHAFATPGTYFVVLRVTSQREGDPKTPYARIRNLERVRVVVK